MGQIVGKGGNGGGGIRSHSFQRLYFLISGWKSAFYPDAKRVAQTNLFGINPYATTVLDAATGAKLADIPGMTIGWTSNDTLLVHAGDSNGGKLQLVKFDGTGATDLAPEVARWEMTRAFRSPDGKKVVGNRRGANLVCVMTLATPGAAAACLSTPQTGFPVWLGDGTVLWADANGKVYHFKDGDASVTVTPAGVGPGGAAYQGIAVWAGTDRAMLEFRTAQGGGAFKRDMVIVKSDGTVAATLDMLNGARSSNDVWFSTRPARDGTKVLFAYEGKIVTIPAAGGAETVVPLLTGSPIVGLNVAWLDSTVP